MEKFVMSDQTFAMLSRMGNETKKYFSALLKDYFLSDFDINPVFDDEDAEKLWFWTKVNNLLNYIKQDEELREPFSKELFREIEKHQNIFEEMAIDTE